MSRFLVQFATGLAAAAGLSVILASCAHDDSSFFLQGVLAPPTGSSSGCMFTNDPTQPQLFYGILDVEAVRAFADNYQAVFLAGNQLTPTASQAQLMTETNNIEIKGAVVQVTDSSTPPVQLAYYTTPGDGFAYASNGTTPGYGLVTLTIVDPNTVESLRNNLGWLERETIIANVKAFGDTLGGDHVETQTYVYPIIACRGCLISFDATDFAINPIPNCLGIVAAGAAQGPTICFAGQDVEFPCGLCTLDSEECPWCKCGAAPGSKTPFASNAMAPPTCSCPNFGSTDGGVGGG